jgi:hypothetical protein
MTTRLVAGLRPQGLRRPPHPIEVRIARAQKRPVKSLAARGPRWYPDRRDRWQLLMGRWMVPDPTGEQACIEAAVPTPGGQWEPRDIPAYWTSMAEAWPLWTEVATPAGTFVGGDGYATLEFAEAGEHGSGVCCLPPLVNVCGADRAPWSAHLHLGLLGASASYPAPWVHNATYCAHGATAMQAICLVYLLAKGIRISRSLLLAPEQIRVTEPRR